MKLDNVYVGCTNDGKERVFQKKFCNYDGCGNTVYIDLKTNEKFLCSEIDMGSLVHYTKIFTNKKYSFKRKIVKTYKSNMNLLYHVDNLFVGNIYRVDWVNDFYNDDYCSRDNRPMNVSFECGNRLFVRICNTEYRDLVTQEVYKKLGEDTLNIGDLCVSDLENVQECLDLSFDKGIVNKQYVLRKCYQRFGNK